MRSKQVSDAVALALALVVADQGADQGHGVVLKGDFSRLLQTSLAHRFYDRRYGRVDGAPLLAHWFFALEAAVCLVDYMYCHVRFSSSMSF